jgi:16S rRNA processing protein RimM
MRSARCSASWRRATAATSSWRSSATTPEQPPRLAVARVSGAKGLRGAVRVEILTDWPEHLDEGACVFVEGESEPRQIVRAETGGRVLAVTLSGITSRDAADALVGRYLEVDAKPLEEGRYYWHQLVGLAVSDPAGRELGHVAEVFRAGDSEVYRIEGPDGELLVPAVRHVVTEIDLAAGRMVVDYDAEEIR